MAYRQKITHGGAQAGSAKSADNGEPNLTSRRNRVPSPSHKAGECLRLLVHCTVHQIREGFEANIRKLSLPVDMYYADLTQEGMFASLKYSPDLIVLLQYECDSDYLLPLKISLFAYDYPILVLAPAMPDRYYHFLRMLGVEHIVQLPLDDEELHKKIAEILSAHGKP